MLEISQENLGRNMEFESIAKYVFSTVLTLSGTTQMGWFDSSDAAGC
jgi:hypothetical protein